MRKLIVPIVMLTLTALQNSIFEYVKILGVKPDIVLTFIICVTLIRGNPVGTVIGVCGGILEDVFFQGAFGINSIGCMLSAFLIGSVEGKIYKDNIFVPGIFVFSGTIIKEFIVYMLLYLTRSNLDITLALTQKIIPEAIYNTILVIFMYRYVVKLNNKYFC